MPDRQLVLASASPARLRLLREAGFDPTVVVSGVDESAITADTPEQLVQALATAKADVVCDDPVAADAVVVGCDSLLLHDGRTLGKPSDPEQALQRWRRMSGTSGELLTGHQVVDLRSGLRAAGVARTTVRFGTPTDEELAAYLRTGEPVQVAGGFTIDGRSAPFVDGIDGDPSNVIGLSLPLLRRLLRECGVGIMELWR